MTKKMLGVFTSIVAALAVVGVAWAGTDDGTSTSASAAGETSTRVSIEDSSSSTEATIASSTDATVASTTRATVDSTATSIDDRDDDSTTSTSIDHRDDDDTSTSTTIESTTSTSIDDSDERTVPDGVSTHIVPGVGTVTVEVKSGRLALVSVTAPGWSVEQKKIEADRIELEFTTALDAEAEFEARLGNGRLEIETEVKSG